MGARNGDLLGIAARACVPASFGEAGARALGAAVWRLSSVGAEADFRERDEPWLTDVFFRAILRGEAAASEARQSLTGAKEVEISGSGTDETEQEDDPVVAGDRRLRTASGSGRDALEADFRSRLETLSVGEGKTAALARAWLGRHGPLPLVPYRAWSVAELAKLDRSLAREEAALAALASGNDDSASAKAARALVAARSAEAARRLEGIPRADAEAIALEIDALELLHGRCHSIAYGMNRRGAGSVPALHVEGRRTRDGGTVGTGVDEVEGADAVLDAMAMDAFLWFAGVRETDGRRVCDFGPVRRYLEGPANARYLTGMIQDAVAGRRGSHFAQPGDGTPLKVSADQPLGTDDGDGGMTLSDTFAAEPDDCGEAKDRSRFYLEILGKLSPKLLRYFKLVRSGVSKGEALRLVGAKSAHFVQREACDLVRALGANRSPDFAELAALVKAIAKEQ